MHFGVCCGEKEKPQHFFVLWGLPLFETSHPPPIQHTQKIVSPLLEKEESHYHQSHNEADPVYHPIVLVMFPKQKKESQH
jgi:hypothetical protein